MEKLLNHPLILKLKLLLHSEGQSKTGGVHLVWRLILSVALLVALGLSVVAWFSYGWAIKETDLPFSRTHRDAFSIEELRAVIEVYQKKEIDHAELKHARPSAPALGLGAGIVLDKGN